MLVEYKGLHVLKPISTFQKLLEEFVTVKLKLRQLPYVVLILFVLEIFKSLGILFFTLLVQTIKLFFVISLPRLIVLKSCLLLHHLPLLLLVSLHLHKIIVIDIAILALRRLYGETDGSLTLMLLLGTLSNQLHRNLILTEDPVTLAIVVLHH